MTLLQDRHCSNGALGPTAGSQPSGLEREAACTCGLAMGEGAEGPTAPGQEPVQQSERDGDGPVGQALRL